VGEDDRQAVRRQALIELDAAMHRIELRASEHLQACWEAMDAYDNDLDAAPNNPAFAPFCGCDVCTVREVLLVVWEEMWKAAESGVSLGLTYDDAGPAAA